MQGKNSFVLYIDMISTISKLSDARAGQLFKLILDYVNDKNPNEPKDKILGIAFEPIKQALKRDLRKWESNRVKRSEAGKLGGIKSGESRKKEANEANASQSKQNEANEAVSVSGIVSVSVSDSVIKRERGAFAPPALQDVIFEMSKKLDEFSAMGQGQQFINHYTSNGWMVGKNKMKDWPAAARGWISRMGNYQPKKLNGSRNIHERLQKEGHEKV